jgi:hypothetical protein
MSEGYSCSDSAASYQWQMISKVLDHLSDLPTLGLIRFSRFVESMSQSVELQDFLQLAF